jgi:NhaA family Na+:H+ antiporter
MGLIGLLAGIDFTMPMFIAMLALADANLLGAAQLDMMLDSVMTATLGWAEA